MKEAQAAVDTIAVDPGVRPSVRLTVRRSVGQSGEGWPSLIPVVAASAIYRALNIRASDFLATRRPVTYRFPLSSLARIRLRPLCLSVCICLPACLSVSLSVCLKGTLKGSACPLYACRRRRQ